MSPEGAQQQKRGEQFGKRNATSALNKAIRL